MFYSFITEAKQLREKTMKTNNIHHDLKLNCNVWSLNCLPSQIFKVIGFTEKRVACKEIGRNNGNGLELYTKESNTSYHSIENLFEA